MNQRNFTVTDDLIASKGQRITNYLIDFAIQYAIAILIGIAIVLIAEMTNHYALAEYIQTMNRLEEYLMGLVILGCYYFITENFLGRSIGKFESKTIVVLEDGSKPDSGYILKRTLSRMIPFDALSFLRTPSRGWHDSISDTYVVDKEQFEHQLDLHNSFNEIGEIGNQ